MPGRETEPEGKGKGNATALVKLEHDASFSGRPYFTKDTSAAKQNQVLMCYICMAQYQGSYWYCFPSERQKRNSSREAGAQLAKVHKIFSFLG